MRKITLMLLVCFLTAFVVGCQQDETISNSNNTADSSSEKKKDIQKKIYGANEEAFITNADGEKIYSLIINSAEIVNVEPYYEDDLPMNTKHVLALTYTYNFIKEEEGTLEELKIMPWDMQVYDENSVSIEYIDLAASDYPFDSVMFNAINAGRSTQVYDGYALKNDTPVIQVDFNSELFGQKLTFEIPVEG